MMDAPVRNLIDHSPIDQGPCADLQTFGKTKAGDNIECIKLTNSSGTEIQLLNLGATIHRIKTADHKGDVADIVLYCEHVEDLVTQKAYLGAIVGRYANRIGNSRFELDGKQILLSANEGVHHLHGGPDGFNKRIWRFKFGCDEDSSYAQFQLVSEDGDQGYPGQLSTDIEYRLFNDNRLSIDIKSITTAPTVVNITSHPYFNLSGTLFNGLGNHYFSIPSKQVCDIDENSIPTGKFYDLKGSMLNLEDPTEVARLLQTLPVELIGTRGFDHTYTFENNADLGLRATVSHSTSGRKLTVYSTQPGLQFYTGNHLDESLAIGPEGQAYKKYNGFCVEPQHFPDSPNHAGFPSTRLDPNETYHQQIVYQFGLT